MVPTYHPNMFNPGGLLPNGYYKTWGTLNYQEMHLSLLNPLGSIWNFKLKLLGSQVVYCRWPTPNGYFRSWGILHFFVISLYLCQFNLDLYETLNISSPIFMISLYICQFNLNLYETFNFGFWGTNQQSQLGVVPVGTLRQLLSLLKEPFGVAPYISANSTQIFMKL